MVAHLLYALIWLSFGLQHSLLARPAIQERIARHVGRSYRLIYNILAAIHFTLVLACGWLWLDQNAFPLPIWLRAGMYVVSALGGQLIILTVRQYGFRDFLGVRALSESEENRVDQPLKIDGFNACVRHPIYLGSLLLFWGLAQSQLGMANALWASVYILVGAHFEERDLLARYGDAYRDYRQRVPMIVPRVR